MHPLDDNSCEKDSGRGERGTYSRHFDMHAILSLSVGGEFHRVCDVGEK